MSTISSNTSNSDALNSTSSTIRNAGKEIEREAFGSDFTTTSSQASLTASQLSLRQRLESSQQNSDDDFDDNPPDTFRRKTDTRRRRRNPMFVENLTSTPIAR